VTAQNTVNIATPSFSAVNLQNWINAADSPTGFVLANGSRQMGDVNAASLTTRNNGWVSQNLKLVGGNWLFDGSSQFGWVRTNSSAFGAVDWISTAASAAAGSTATLLDIAYWGINGAYVKVPWGIGVTPRPTYQFDISVNGTVRTMVQSLDNQVSLRTSVTNAGVFQDVARYDANAAIVTASGVPLTYNLQDVSGAMFQAMSMKVNKQIQIGNGTDGSICSTQKSLGAVNGPVDLTQRQTTVVNASSTITAITMAPGQIARLFVAGNGSITLPATVRLPRGGVAYGVACTIISLYFDGTNIWSTFTPFDGSFP
jgi:hypothetical protein